MLWPYKTHEVSTELDEKRGIQVTDIRPRRRKLRRANPILIQRAGPARAGHGVDPQGLG